MIRNRTLFRNLKAILLILCLGSAWLEAQPFLPVESIADTVAMRPALPDTLLNSYLAESDFRAMFDESVNTDIISAIFRWLWEKILSFIFTPALMPYWQILLYVLVIVIFVYFLSRVFRVNYRGLFYRPQERPGLRGPVLKKEDLSGNIAQKIQDAINRRHYREALRLLFVQTLQNLNRKNHIILARGKTNREYLRDLHNPELKEPFRRLVLIFDYVWYGEFPLSPERFRQLQVYFDSFKKQLGGG